MLRYVDAVARRGGFTRAAEELHVAQPSISMQIGRLERTLGTTLFVRSARGVRTTEAGDRFLVRARRILEEVDAIDSDFAEIDGLLAGTLRVGATPLLSGLDLAGVLGRFHDAHPGVLISVRSDLVAPLLQGLAAGDLDVVIGPGRLEELAGFRAEVVAEETLVLACPPDLDPLPRDIASAAAHDFVCLGPDSGLRSLLHQAAGAAAVAVRVSAEAANARQLREFVAAGLGVALMAGSAAREPGPEITVVDLVLPVTHPPLVAVQRVNAGPRAAEEFTAMLRSGSAPATW
ncbi:MAG: LysR family transcriptional regulator [Marmoricola sp.]